MAVAIVSLVTGLLRAIPFLVFKGKTDLPETVRFLGSYLPPAIMIILVIYCLRGVNILEFPHGLAEIISVIIIIGIQYLKKSTLLSIFLGTGSYMILIRLIPNI